MRAVCREYRGSRRAQNTGVICRLRYKRERIQISDDVRPLKRGTAGVTIL